MPRYTIGRDAKLYWGQAGNTANTELTDAKDVNVNLEASEADVSTRGSGGWEATAPGRRRCTIDFQLQVNPDDRSALEAFRNAFLTGGEIALLALDNETGEGPDGDFTITNFSRSEALDDPVVVDVSAKLAVYRGWQEPS